MTTRFTEEKIIERIKRRVKKNDSNAYHILVSEYKLYNKNNYGFINTYVKAKVSYSTKGNSEVVGVVDFGIEQWIKIN